MDTVVITRTFAGDLDGMVAHCRSLKSRQSWPGAVLEYEQPGSLDYAVGIRLKSATMIEIKVHEALGELDRSADGQRFDTSGSANWPDGLSGIASEYLFTTGPDGRNTLRLTYSYTAPSRSLVKPRDLPAFHDAMERVVQLYVEDLIETQTGAPAGVPGESAPAIGASEAPTAAPTEKAAAPAPVEDAAGRSEAVVDLGAAAVGMETVTVSREFEQPVEQLVAYTRTLGSRGAWPGSQLEFEGEDQLIFGVGMRLRGATMTDITVEEKLGPNEQLADGEVRFRTVQRVTWPEGHADGLCEYRFIPGDATSPNTVQFTYAYAPPSTKLVKTKQLPAFRQAMYAVANRYLKNLSRDLERV